MIEIEVNQRKFDVFFNTFWMGLKPPQQRVVTCVIHGPGGAFTGVSVCNPSDLFEEDITIGKRLAFKRAAENLARFMVDAEKIGFVLLYKDYAKFLDLKAEAFRAYRLALKEPDELEKVIEIEGEHQVQAERRRVEKVARKLTNIKRQQEIQAAAKERRRFLNHADLGSIPPMPNDLTKRLEDSLKDLDARTK